MLTLTEAATVKQEEVSKVDAEANELRQRAQAYREMAEQGQYDPARWTRRVDMAAWLDRKADALEAAHADAD